MSNEYTNPDELPGAEPDEKTEYTLLLESDAQAGSVLVYWGLAHFRCNFEDPRYPSREFLIMYAREVSAEIVTPNKFIIGVAARDLSKGEPIRWNPSKDTKDVISQGGPRTLVVPDLPKNTFVIPNDPEV